MHYPCNIRNIVFIFKIDRRSSVRLSIVVGKFLSYLTQQAWSHISLRISIS